MSYPARCLPPPLAPPFVMDGSSAVMGAAGEYHGSFGLLTAITAGPE